MEEDYVKVIPLGGLSEIGLNSTVFETKNDAILIDAGLMFPEEDMLGVDLVIPNFDYVYENAKKFRALFVTHAHEDHVGAIPYLLKNINVPIYGTKLTLGIIRAKLREFKMNPKMIEIDDHKIYNIGDFAIEPIRVTHSIVDGVGFAITHDVGTIVHTGDFKIDHTPVDGKPLDILKFSEYGSKGVKLLMSDSTNANVKGFTGSERAVGEALSTIFANAKKRILLVTFASNIHRVQQVINIAEKLGKKVCISGKSMVQNSNIAKELGYLNVPDGILISDSDLDSYPDENVVIITTGSQGEPMSGLSRIAFDEHKKIKVKPTDTIIISAKTIPGNEKAALKVINSLAKKGVDLFYEQNSNVHVSGHASQEELKFMISVTKPEYFMPIHGEYMMRRSHSKIAETLGVNPRNILNIDNGDVVKVTKKGVAMDGRIKSGRVFIDGKNSEGVQDVVLHDRMKLSTEGFVAIIVAIDDKTGEIGGDPQIIIRGLTHDEKSQKLVSEASAMIKNLVNQSNIDMKTDAYEIKKKIRKAMGKFLYKKLKKNPMILPIIL